jgi:hypothetical protein
MSDGHRSKYLKNPAGDCLTRAWVPNGSAAGCVFLLCRLMLKLPHIVIFPVSIARLAVMIRDHLDI